MLASIVKKNMEDNRWNSKIHPPYSQGLQKFAINLNIGIKPEKTVVNQFPSSCGKRRPNLPAGTGKTNLPFSDNDK